MTDRDINLGSAIREARLAAGLTLVALGQSIGRTAGYLSQVEHGKIRPSLEALRNISNAIGVHPSWFFSSKADGETTDPFIVRKNGRRKLSYSGGVVNELMSPNLNGPLELLMTVLEPGAASGDEATHRGHECGVIVKGKLGFSIGSKEYLLEEGDSFSFSSDTPHNFFNPTAEETKVVWVLTPPVL